MSGIDSAKATMGYIRAKDRPGCANCAKGQFRDCIHPTWWCDLGDFLTSPMAVCDKHQAGPGCEMKAKP